MTKQVLYDNATSRVLQWQDLAQFGYAEPGIGQSLLPVTDAEWVGQPGPWFVMAGALTQTDPHPAPEIPLAQAQASALASIDAAAGAARARYITVAPGQEATYMLKAEQARAYKAAGYPAVAVANYPMVEAEAKAINGAAPTAAQFQAAADGIIAQADAWIATAAQIERARIAGKRAVTAAANVAGVEAARLVAVAELVAL